MVLLSEIYGFWGIVECMYDLKVLKNIIRFYIKSFNQILTFAMSFVLKIIKTNILVAQDQKRQTLALQENRAI